MARRIHLLGLVAVVALLVGFARTGNAWAQDELERLPVEACPCVWNITDLTAEIKLIRFLPANMTRAQFDRLSDDVKQQVLSEGPLAPGANGSASFSFSTADNQVAAKLIVRALYDQDGQPLFQDVLVARQSYAWSGGECVEGQTKTIDYSVAALWGTIQSKLREMQSPGRGISLETDTTPGARFTIKLVMEGSGTNPSFNQTCSDQKTRVFNILRKNKNEIEVEIVGD